MRRYIESAGDLTGGAPGDPDKIADAILASVDVTPAPLRLTLGSDAYRMVHAALSDRIERLEAAHELALSTDVETTRSQ
jgi:hypothetical protein